MARHPNVIAILRYFDYGHLDDNLSPISRACHDLAHSMAAQIEDSSELVAGLRKLLEAKDCFVRAKLP